MSETPYMRRVMLAALKHRCVLFRNNVGLFYTRTGAPVRCGLAVGSSDLIGATEHVVTAADVGRTLAVFTAIETKSRRGGVRPEQVQFINAMRAMGAFAGFAREGEDIDSRLFAITTGEE